MRENNQRRGNGPQGGRGNGNGNRCCSGRNTRMQNTTECKKGGSGFGQGQGRGKGLNRNISQD
ncbi:MAG: hypothetical protein ACJAWW_001682 [Sulfurimonas sp.]|jgi:hypothetical protein